MLSNRETVDQNFVKGNGDVEVKSRAERVVKGLPGVLPPACATDGNLNLMPSQEGCLMREWQRMRIVATTDKAWSHAGSATLADSWRLAIAFPEVGIRTA